MLAYRLLLSLITPFALLRLLWLWARGRETSQDIAERLGFGRGPASNDPLIWLHGASNGEIASAHQLVMAALARDPALRFLITANTVTGRKLAESWQNERVEARLAPLDHQVIVARILNRWKPRAYLLLENELWPNRLRACVARSIPVMAIGARMSEKSARTWARLGPIARPTFGAIAWLSAQDAASQARFQALGLPDARTGPVCNLKANINALPVSPAEAAPIAALWPRETTFLAASTHAGEDAILIDAFIDALKVKPAIRMIIAPRHPRRAPEIVALLQERGLAFARRSTGELPDDQTQVYLADTMGEMALLYHLAGLTFVGGSLVAVGGHTPYEPAAARSAILHGPLVTNFHDAYRALKGAKAAIELSTAPEIAKALIAASEPSFQHAMTRAAQAALQPTESEVPQTSLLTKLAELAEMPALLG